MDIEPLILVLSIGKRNADRIVEGILDCPTPPFKVSEGGKSYKWLIENKYYSSSLEIATLEHPKHASQSVIKRTEALILIADLTKASIKEISTFLEPLELSKQEIKLLVCDRYQGEFHSGVYGVQQWCIENEWEIVELNPEEVDIDDDTKEGFSDIYGFNRIKEALHAHTWSNLVMKDSKNCAMNSMLKMMTLSDAADTQDTSGQTIKNPQTQVPALADNASEEDQMDEFDSLLSAFGEMKTKASNLPQDQRKLYAENVTLSFWRALGGDEEEIEDLDLPND